MELDFNSAMDALYDKMVPKDEEITNAPTENLRHLREKSAIDKAIRDETRLAFGELEIFMDMDTQEKKRNKDEQRVMVQELNKMIEDSDDADSKKELMKERKNLMKELTKADTDTPNKKRKLNELEYNINTLKQQKIIVEKALAEALIKDILSSSY